MGICASCLGLSSDSDDQHDDPPEASPLLGPRQTRETADYGAARTNADNAVPDLVHTSNAVQERHEADYLNEVWRFTSDKLIDITQLTTASNAGPAADEPSTGSSLVDYERIFEDTFPRRPYSGGRPGIGPETFTPPSSAGEGKGEGAGVGRSGEGDPAAVRKIGRPLIIDFDEVAAEGENERVLVGR